MMKKFLAFASAAVLAASLGGCSKSEAESSAAGSQASSEENKTLTEKMMENMKAGEYSIDITVSGLESSGDTDCKITAHDGKTFTSLNYGGIYTEFYSIDDKTYLLMPDVNFYQISDESKPFADGLFSIGEGDSLSSAKTENGETTEIYTSVDSTAESGSTDEKFTFVYDEETGELKSITSETSSGTTEVTVNSINWSGADINLPDLTGWEDMSDSENLDHKSQLKLSLYYMGITEEDLDKAGYTYDDLADMDDDKLAEALSDLGVNIFG